MHDFVVDLIDRLGLVGIALMMMLENIIPPLPSEAVMGSAALAIEEGRMQFWPVLAAGTIGTLAGNFFWFWVGHRYGYERLEPFINRFGRWLTVEWEDVEKASAFFRRWGHWLVLVLRTTPVMRTLISLPAGLSHMSVTKFVIFTSIGAATWNALLIGGTRWIVRHFPGSEDLIGWLIVAIAVLAVAGYLYRLATWKPRSQRP
ncbi:DedA family protein [Erythrobacteraceae bacterium CFH 75059]|uniref:DedA family protein n=1 Tax=Qipengyuania thermophila TaxID=2509361 RepID=UPI00102236E4|nr:DedA family protein [Qipengyuania thermophila]TCD05177.1 DedA family protein [Erythrobacteraceae bacterium CFH 75059]